MKSYIVDKNNEGQRLNKYCGRILSEAPQSFVYKMLRKKNITLNSKKADGSEIIKMGDEVKFFLSDDTFQKFSKEVSANENIKIIKDGDVLDEKEIVFESEDILIAFKKPGELSQKADKNDISINERIVNYLSPKSNEFTPGICNRLDRNTQGLITAGKTLRGQRFLAELFRERKIDKYYLAVVSGTLNKKIDQKLYLVKNNDSNKVIISREKQEGAEIIHNVFYPIKASNGLTLVKIKLKTGKSHQIRAHLDYLGFPILGDTKYCTKGTEKSKGMARAYKLKYQLLLAYELIFPNECEGFPEMNGKRIVCKLPEAFEKVCEGEKLWPGNPEDLEVRF